MKGNCYFKRGKDRKRKGKPILKKLMLVRKATGQKFVKPSYRNPRGK